MMAESGEAFCFSEKTLLVTEPAEGALCAFSSEMKGQAIELPLRILRNGCWYYKSRQITDMATKRFLASLLVRDQAGDYFLQTPSGRGKIEVEDAPFLAVGLRFSGLCEKRQVISLRTNIGETFCVGSDHPLFCRFNPADGVAALYLHLKTPPEGGAPILARLSKSVIFELGALGCRHEVEGEMCLGVWSLGVFFPIPCAF